MPRIVEIPVKHPVSWERLKPEGSRWSPLPVALWGPLIVAEQEYLRVGALVERRKMEYGDLEATVAVHAYTSNSRTEGPQRSAVFTLKFQVPELNPLMALLRAEPREVLLFDRNGLWVPFLIFRTEEGAKVVFLDAGFEPYWKVGFAHVGLQFENGHSSWPIWMVYLWQRVTILRWHLKR